VDNPTKLKLAVLVKKKIGFLRDNGYEHSFNWVKDDNWSEQTKVYCTIYKRRKFFSFIIYDRHEIFLDSFRNVGLRGGMTMELWETVLNKTAESKKVSNIKRYGFTDPDMGMIDRLNAETN
jgi:hypothetical protein